MEEKKNDKPKWSVGNALSLGIRAGVTGGIMGLIMIPFSNLYTSMEPVSIALILGGSTIIGGLMGHFSPDRDADLMKEINESPNGFEAFKALITGGAVAIISGNPVIGAALSAGVLGTDLGDRFMRERRLKGPKA